MGSGGRSCGSPTGVRTLKAVISISPGAAEEIGLTAAGADAVDVRILKEPDDYGGAPRKERGGLAAPLLERPYLGVFGRGVHTVLEAVDQGLP